MSSYQSQGESGASARAGARAPAAAAETRVPQRRRIHGGAPALPPLSVDVGRGRVAVDEPPAPRKRTWRSTLVGVAIGLGVVLVFVLKWLLNHQIETAEERRLQQKAMRAAVAHCHEQVARAAIEACLKALEVSGAAPR